MLKEMRDAAGDSGEFYTPRPVVKLIVDRVAPKLGERVLDPACCQAENKMSTKQELKKSTFQDWFCPLTSFLNSLTFTL
jgi:type I restriction enzyme M protein